MADNKLKKNMIIGVSCRMVILALGIVLPRLVMLSFGSEANGLLNTVSQIFSYVALLEAGIGNATLNALYKPLGQNDREQTQRILASAVKLFRKTTVVYMLCVVGLSVTLPFVIETELSKMTVALVTLLQGMAGALNYYLTAAHKQMLTADGKNYVSENAQLLTHVASTAGKIVLIQLGADIVALQVLNLVVTAVGIIFLRAVVKKQYSWLNLKKAPKDFVLKERGAFVIHELAGTVFSCTDLIAISTMCGLAESSVYSVYNLIYSSLSTLLSTVTSGTAYLLGQAYHKGQKYFQRVYDVYDRAYCCLVFSVMTIACSLTLPFIKLYTAGVNDAQYLDRFLPYLFAAVAVLSSCRATANRAIAVAGHMGRTKWRAILETAINLCLTIVFVKAIGIHGALLGTIVALLYRTVDMILYANHKILNRTCGKSIGSILLLMMVALVEVFLLQKIAGKVDSYFSFVAYGLLFAVVIFVFNFGVVGLLSIKDIRWLRFQEKNVKMNENNAMRRGEN